MSKINEATFVSIQEIIGESFGISPADIKPDSSIKNDLGLDSLDVIELIMNMENYFDIAIVDAKAEIAIEQKGTVEALAELVEPLI